MLEKIVIDLKNKFMKSFQGNNFIFECSNKPPVMNIEKKKGDLSFKYLDMSKYFCEKKSPVYLSIYKDNLRKSFNHSNIHQMIKRKMEKYHQGDYLLNQIYQ